MYFTELQEFGWNWLSASFVVLIAITTWQYRAFFLQTRNIWRERSAKSVSITMATGLFFISIGTLWYGFQAHLLVAAYTGGLAILSFLIMLGAWKFGRPGIASYTVLACGCAWSLLMFTSMEPKFVFSGFTIGLIVPIVAQVREIYKTRSRGVLHIEWLAVALVKNVFLNIFAFASGDIVYRIFSPIFLALSVWQFVLWLRFKET